MDEEKVYKVVCKCCLCGEEIEVEFLLPPTEEDKIGYVCKKCENKVIDLS
jgi:hypothetical protein